MSIFLLYIMSRNLTKRLDAQLKKVLKDNSAYYTCCMNTENIMEWYVLIQNLPEPFIDGEFLFLLKIPDDFPEDPPSLIALTPNGVMEIGGRVCVSLGEFHKDQHFKTGNKGHFGWIPSLGISGFVLQGIINALLNFTDGDQGVRLNNLSTEDKQKLAKKSKQYNTVNNSYIKDLFTIHRACFPYLAVFSTS